MFKLLYLCLPTNAAASMRCCRRHLHHGHNKLPSVSPMQSVHVEGCQGRPVDRWRSASPMDSILVEEVYRERTIRMCVAPKRCSPCRRRGLFRPNLVIADARRTHPLHRQAAIHLADGNVRVEAGDWRRTVRISLICCIDRWCCISAMVAFVLKVAIADSRTATPSHSYRQAAVAANKSRWRQQGRKDRSGSPERSTCILTIWRWQ